MKWYLAFLPVSSSIKSNLCVWLIYQFETPLVLLESHQEILLTKTQAKKTFVLSEASSYFASQKSILSFSVFIQV